MVKYLVMLKHQTKALVRDGVGFGSPMKQVCGWSPTIFDNLPQGCPITGNSDFEIRPIQTEDELQAYTDQMIKSKEAEVKAFNEHAERTEAKRQSQLAGGREVQAEVRAVEVAKAFIPDSDATLGAALISEGKDEAPVIQDTSGEMVKRPVRKKKGKK